MLVYEFVANGTLYDLIHCDANNRFPVTWNMRLKIAADLAGALAYLHSASSTSIYHKDIKSSDFLLDSKYVVKVADFGLSKFVSEDKTHLTTMEIRGTCGYIDPEFWETGQYSEKSDVVFSFGVVLVELLTGKKPMFQGVETSESGGGMLRDLAAYFCKTMEKNNLNEMWDPQVSKHYKKEQVIAVAGLAKRCLDRERKMRPTMKEVSAELEAYFKISQTEESDDEVEFEDAQNAWTTSSDIFHSCMEVVRFEL